MANHSDLLQILNAHGQQFAESFKVKAPPRKRKRAVRGPVPILLGDQNEDDTEEEWKGCESKAGSEDIAPPQVKDQLTSARIQFVTFSSPGSTTPGSTSREQMKSFMSPKIEKMRTNVEQFTDIDGDGDDDEELTNAENDALLHRLVHTQILSGSLKPDLSLTGNQRRKALAGRILEVSGGARLGKGEVVVRATERDSAAPRVRIGMLQKQKERGRQQLEQVKALGNYHPAIKKLLKPSDTSSTRKRQEGIQMGVGKFRRGTLHLSQDEIDAVQDARHRQSSKQTSKRHRSKR